MKLKTTAQFNVSVDQDDVLDIMELRKQGFTGKEIIKEGITVCFKKLKPREEVE